MQRPNIACHDHHLSPRPRHAPPPRTTTRTQKETTRTAGAKVRLHYFPFFFLFTDADVAASQRVGGLKPPVTWQPGEGSTPSRFVFDGFQHKQGGVIPSPTYFRRKRGPSFPI